MKRYAFILIGVLLSSFTFSQTGLDKKYLSVREVKTKHYMSPSAGADQLYLEMSFGKNTIKNPRIIKQLKDVEIISVELLFSDYPRGKNFDQLNSSRFIELRKLNPDLFKDESISWLSHRQTNCSNSINAKNLFHGFVISYRPKPTKKIMAQEIRKLKDLISSKKNFEENPKADTSHSVIMMDSIALFNTEWINQDDQLDTIININWSDEAFYEEEVNLNFYYNPTKQDLTVQKVLERNNWKNVSVVCDVTGSMYPYTGQFLAWLKLNSTSNPVQHFACFNDGDWTPDHLKMIGSTGGIYHSDDTEFNQIENTIYKAMRNGGGGDCQENDLEAILDVLKKNEDCQELILIADNWAPVKDIKLLKEINIPIRIICCGTSLGINVEYLNIARATGGSLHLMEKDLTELANLNEGKSICIAGITYKIKNGEFVRLTKT